MGFLSLRRRRAAEPVLAAAPHHRPLRLRRTIAIVSTHGKRACMGRPATMLQHNFEAVMVQTTNRFFDEVARLMNDAAGVAQGVRREFETLFRTQAERFLRDLDVVKREEFEAVKDMARLAREENDALKARIAALEAAHAAKSAPATAPSGGGFPGEAFPGRLPDGSGGPNPGTY
jgi:BMFP domain-containing protein YqiC